MYTLLYIVNYMSLSVCKYHIVKMVDDEKIIEKLSQLENIFGV